MRASPSFVSVAGNIAATICVVGDGDIVACGSRIRIHADENHAIEGVYDVLRIVLRFKWKGGLLTVLAQLLG